MPSEKTELLAFLIAQCGDREVAHELFERKQKNPSLCGATVRGRWISFSLPSKRDGTKFREMVESGGVPGCMTDSVFMEGTANGSQFQDKPHYGDLYAKECLKRGGQVKGRKYISQIAQFPGDPEAWVSGRGDVQRVLEKLGWGSDGSVKAKARQPAEPPSPSVDVADKIVNRETARVLEGQTVTKREYLDTRERVKSRLKGNRKK